MQKQIWNVSSRETRFPRPRDGPIPSVQLRSIIVIARRYMRGGKHQFVACTSN